MTSTTGFILASALLVLVVLGILLPPLWRTPKPAKTVNRGEANLDIFRDQMRELERDHDEGILTDADLKQAKSELQRRLLDEVHPETVPQAMSGGRQTALALLIALPLAATGRLPDPRQSAGARSDANADADADANRATADRSDAWQIGRKAQAEPG
jgi:cytochrome c-type biogenesis protein CcmI